MASASLTMARAGERVALASAFLRPEPSRGLRLNTPSLAPPARNLPAKQQATPRTGPVPPSSRAPRPVAVAAWSGSLAAVRLIIQGKHMEVRDDVTSMMSYQ